MRTHDGYHYPCRIHPRRPTSDDSPKIHIDCTVHHIDGLLANPYSYCGATSRSSLQRARLQQEVYSNGEGSTHSTIGPVCALKGSSTTPRPRSQRPRMHARRKSPLRHPDLQRFEESVGVTKGMQQREWTRGTSVVRRLSRDIISTIRCIPPRAHTPSSTRSDFALDSRTLALALEVYGNTVAYLKLPDIQETSSEASSRGSVTEMEGCMPILRACIGWKHGMHINPWTVGATTALARPFHRTRQAHTPPMHALRARRRNAAEPPSRREYDEAEKDNKSIIYRVVWRRRVRDERGGVSLAFESFRIQTDLGDAHRIDPWRARDRDHGCLGLPSRMSVGLEASESPKMPLKWENPPSVTGSKSPDEKVCVRCEVKIGG
ncbi:hypothetical protein B0H13DRAFT_2404486 [Mycena leptocephala]|nr:hypothetical protein B0H13DRAFT_2404486 [Mycena leptocephala]